MIWALIRSRYYRGLLETCHGVTRAKVGGQQDSALSAEEREAFADWASGLGFATLHRLWQLILKGHGEVTTAPMPVETAEMALLRIVHASTLPRSRRAGETAGERRDDGSVSAQSGIPAAEEQPPLLALPVDFKGLIALVEKSWQALAGAETS